MLTLEGLVFWFLILWLFNHLSWNPQIKHIWVKDVVNVIAIVALLLAYFGKVHI